MKFKHMKVEGAEVEIDTSDRTVWFSINVGMEEGDVLSILADVCGEFGIAEEVLKKNPTLLRDLTKAFNSAADNLRIIEKSILPQMKKTIRAIDRHRGA
jgi:hypothetical protein